MRYHVSQTIKFQANGRMLKDLKELQAEFGTTTMSETIRRLVAREVLSERAKRGARELRLRGDDPDGESVEVIG